jgi:hypothetical protein
MTYVYQILNADAEAGKPNLEWHTRLYRDGEQVYEGKPALLQPVSQQDPKHLIAGGAMKLGPRLTPGDYVLQVVVTDKGHTATQSVDFEVELHSQ